MKISLSRTFVTIVLFWLIPFIKGHEDIFLQISEISKRLEAEPNAASLFIQRASLHRLHSEWKLAESDYDRAIKIDSLNSDAHFGKAGLYTESGYPHKALESLNRAGAIAGESINIRQLRVRIFQDLGRWRESRDEAVLLLNSSSSPPISHYLILAQAQAGGPNPALTEAQQTLASGLAAFPDSQPLLSESAAVAESRKDYKAALAQLDSLIAKQRRPEWLLLRRSRLCSLAGDNEQAIRDCRDALSRVAALPVFVRETPAVKGLEDDLRAVLADCTVREKAIKQ